MESVKGKTALITGAGSGINLSFAKILYSHGANILLADLSLTPEASDWIKSSTSPERILFHKTDVTKWKQLTAAFDAAEQKFGTVVDITVPGAGVYEPSVPNFWNEDDDGRDDDQFLCLSINLIHPIKATRIAVRRLVEAKKPGAIIYVSSVAGQKSSLATPLYTVSKHGVNALCLSMAALEKLAGIRVGAVAPGVIATPLYDHTAVSNFVDREKDLMLPKEVVGKAMYSLLTDKKYKSGTILEVTDFENWREVSILQDPPQGPAKEASNKTIGLERISPYLGGIDLSGLAPDNTK